VIPNDSLQRELAILLATHGQEPVLHALATTLKLSNEDLGKLIDELGSAKPRTRTGPTPTIRDVIDSLSARSPGKADTLRQLVIRYVNRTFLPDLRDVRRFFDRHSRSLGQVRSRAKALPELAALLADLPVCELRDLCDVPEQDEYSSLGVISNQILRPERK
jgi:hypothetical protein